MADIGTAATFDFVAPGAVYAGGNIAPGIGMRLKALHSYTAALPEPETDGPIPAWGKSTGGKTSEPSKRLEVSHTPPFMVVLPLSIVSLSSIAWQNY